MTETEAFSPLRYEAGVLFVLDQTRLPHEEVWLECRGVEQVCEAIRRLSVRGAPAIGVAAAFGLALALRGVEDEAAQRRVFEKASARLAATRPTAVNLRWALERGEEVFEEALATGHDGLAERLEDWAETLRRRDIETNRRIGEHGARLFARDERGGRVLTHCNTGSLATAGHGTALGVIASSFDRGDVETVWVDETRPLLQGARLTTWELDRLAIPYQLVTDSSAGLLLSRGAVDRIVVGADRIAANGDTANKIGTYTLAVLAARHEVPFYVAAPTSTIDETTATGAEIPIEERGADEVTDVFGVSVAPREAPATNYAFDVTPAELIDAIITEVGVLEPPYEESIERALRAGR